MTGIGLAYAMLLLLVGQADLQQPERADEAQQFIAADPVLRVSADAPPVETKAQAKPARVVNPRFQGQPKIVAPRLMAAPAKRAVGVQAPERKAIRLKHVPAADVSNAIRELLRGEGGNAAEPTVIVDEPVSNTILISATTRTLEQIMALVEALDQKPASIQIDAALIQVTRDGDTKNRPGDLPSRTWKEGTSAAVKELAERGSVRVLAHPSLLVVDSQAAFVQVGQREPRLTGVRESPQGRSNEMELENVGLILGVTARANGEDRITMEIDLEDSRMGDQQQGAVLATMSNGEVVRSPSVNVSTMQSTICVRNGQAVALGSVMELRDDRYSELWMIVEARLVD